MTAQLAEMIDAVLRHGSKVSISEVDGVSIATVRVAVGGGGTDRGATFRFWSAEFGPSEALASALNEAAAWLLANGVPVKPAIACDGLGPVMAAAGHLVEAMIEAGEIVVVGSGDYSLTDQCTLMNVSVPAVALALIKELDRYRRTKP